jgi:hypothetical protein
VTLTSLEIFFFKFTLDACDPAEYVAPTDASSVLLFHPRY